MSRSATNPHSVFFIVVGTTRAFAENDERDREFRRRRALGRPTTPQSRTAGCSSSDRFDFRGGDREALVLDHLFAAVEDVEEVVGVASDDVARPVPAVAQHGGGGLRLLPVSQHELRAAHDQFAGFGRARLRCRFGVEQRGIRFAPAAGRWMSGRSERGSRYPRCVTGEASVMPYPWQTRIPVSSVKRRASSGASGAAPDLTQRNVMVVGKLSGLGGLAQRVQGGRDDWHHGDAFVQMSRTATAGR